MSYKLYKGDEFIENCEDINDAKSQVSYKELVDYINLLNYKSVYYNFDLIHEFADNIVRWINHNEYYGYNHDDIIWGCVNYKLIKE